eukprot:COSAG01_NODE_7605_length_3130_cov_1.686242_1_plen_42_part_10
MDTDGDKCRYNVIIIYVNLLTGFANPCVACSEHGFKRTDGYP